MRRGLLTGFVFSVALACCSPSANTPTAQSPPPPEGSISSPASPASSADPHVPETLPEFSGGEFGIDTERLPHSWRPGCPVAVEDLRLLAVSHWGFDGQPHTGELVVHREEAANVLAAMRALFEVRFPIERMQLVDVYGGDDDRSMAANNTSAFNCREVESNPGTWSQHSYGRAIDINPVQNPYLPRSGAVEPPEGTEYVDRSNLRPGMIVAGDDVVAAFRSIGWEWGGDWTNSKDYQHFSWNGR